MNYASIKIMDVANGPGIRISLFVSGCTHHCKGCFNEEAWDFNYGQPFTSKEIDYITDYLNNPHIAGLSILGGEPMEPANQKGILPLLKKVKELYPQKSIWLYSGYDFEHDILAKMRDKYPYTNEILSYLDVIVDGKFIEEQKNISLRFKGSNNQRIILVKESLKENRIVLWDPLGNDYYK